MTALTLTPPRDLALWRADLKTLLSIGLPMAATQLVQVSVQTVDVLMIGRLGPAPLAAASLGVVFFFTMFIIGLGPAMAMTPVVSHALGRKSDDYDGVRRAVRMGLWLVAMYAPVAVLFLANAATFARLLGQPEDLARLAGPYVLALAPGLPFAAGVVVLRNFLAALGRTRWPLIFIIATTFINAGGNYLLIYGSFGFPKLGLVGAGIASALAYASGFALLAAYAYIDPRARKFAIFRDFFIVDAPLLREIARLGWPIAVNIAFEAMLFNCCIFLVGRIGVAEVAAYQIALNVASIAFMAPLGLSMAGATQIGLAAGAGDEARVRRGVVLTTLLCCLVMIIFWAPIVPNPRGLAGLYLDLGKAENAGVVALVTRFLPLAAAFALFDGAQVAFNQALRGLKDVRMPMMLTGVAYWLVGFPLAAYLGLGTKLGAVGVWWGLLASLVAASGLLGWRVQAFMASGKWRHAAAEGAPAVGGH